MAARETPITNPGSVKPPRPRRWIPLSLRAFVAFLVVLGLTSLWVALDELALREFKFRRITPGISRAEVEAILGQPNPLPGLVRTKEAFWDTYCQFGTKYLSLHINYKADGAVEKAQLTESGGFLEK